jgi:sec-independent protein translocase protein TatC
MTFFEHLQELRIRIIVSAAAILAGSILAFSLFDSIVALLLEPLQRLDSAASGKQLFVHTLFEGFLTKIKISILTGIILSFPVHLYNFIRFIFPGLKRKERRFLVIGLLVSFVLIIFSFYYSYYRIIPLSVRFLTSSHFIPVDVGMLLNYNRNIFYILQFIFITLVVFQTPIILEILLIMNVVQRRTLLLISRYVIVGIFVLSAIITPPDFISQISLTVPLVGLYFLTILIAWIFKFGEE